MTEPELDWALRACSKLEPSSEWLAATRALLEKEKRRKIRARWIRGAAAVALIACAALGATFRDNRLSQVSFRNPKFQIQIDTRVSPLLARLRWYRLGGEILNFQEDWTIRNAYDARTETVRGYEFRTKQLPEGRYRFEVRALTQDPRSRLDHRFRSYRWVELEHMPKPIEVASGERFEVPLASEGTSRVYDELRIVAAPPIAR